MKSFHRKLSALLAVVLIMGTLAMPATAGTTTTRTVTGGATKAQATELKYSTVYSRTAGASYIDNIYTLKATTSVAWFKFKTQSSYAYYRPRMETYPSGSDGLSKNIRVTFQRADGSTIETHACQNYFFEEQLKHYNLQPNSWYYIVIKNPNRTSGKLCLWIDYTKDEDRNTKATAMVLTNAKTYTGMSCPAYMDTDYFKFVPTKTGTYRVIVRGNDNYNNSDYLIASFLRSDGSVVIKKNLKARNAALISDRHLTAGKTYYIKIVGRPYDWFMGDEGDGYYKARITKIN